MSTTELKNELLALVDQLARKVEAGEIEQPERLKQQLEQALVEPGDRLGDSADASVRVFEELPAMVWRSSADQLRNYFNPAWLAFTGRKAEQEIGNGWAEGLHPEDRDRYLAVYSRAFEVRQPFEVEYRLRHVSGEYRWVRSLGRPISNQHGEFAGYIGICFDLTELKEKDQALNESEARFEGLFEFAPDGVVAVGPNGLIELANRQAVEMFGYSLDELRGQPVEMLMPDDYRDRHRHHVHHFMQAPRLRPMGEHLDLVARRKDGSRFPVDITLGPLETAEGTMVMATIRDITLRKQMESELAEVHRRLIDSAEVERLHLAQELHDGPLQELYSIAFQLSELQSMISSHRGKNLSKSLTEQIQQVANSVRAVCGDLRPPALAPYGLERAIRSHARSLSDRHPELTIELDLDADGQELSERVRIMLFRIYQQAIANAIRHAQADRIWVTFRMGGDEVMLDVRDNGRGFEMPGRMVDLVRQGHYGLAGSMERAESIGGRFVVETHPGAGTLARVIAPRHEEAQVTMVERMSNPYSV